MKATLPPMSEHREEPRVATMARARLEAPHAAMAHAPWIIIEEMSACGLRLNSEVPLHPKEAVLLRVPGQALPLHATVLWVREREPAHRRSVKRWVAGCRLEGGSIGQAKLHVAPDPWARGGPFWRKAVLVAGGVIGFLALVVYLYLRFVQIMGQSPQIPH